MKTQRTLSLLQRSILAGLAIVCIAIAWKLPLWHMKLVAPMYPNGLNMIAYGNTVTGDLYELNIVNHYVGMKHISADEFTIMWLFPVGLTIIALLAVLPIVIPKARKWCAIGIFLFPVTILGFIQYYLYQFGHHLNPEAPFHIPEFMPTALGQSTIVNFTATSMIGWGMGSMILAAIITGFGPMVFRKKHTVLNTQSAPTFDPVKAATTGLFILFCCISTSAVADPTLQERIDAAKRGETIVVAAGEYQGPIRIAKPLTLIGKGMPVIRGDKQTDVVSITSDSVTISGFHIIYSGIEITQEAAGIRSQGNHVNILNNEISEVYFGIHILQSDNVRLVSNYIHPGTQYAGRPGHAINIWNVHRIEIEHNTIDDARDGILLTYASNATVIGNTITHCRYGLHSMYGLNITFTANTVRDNLLGLALMYSKVLVARDNIILEHRRGTSPYGFLLKDIDNVTIENNLIEANQIGIFADGISMELGSSSHIRGNTIVGNICGVSVQSSATFSFVGNNMLENLTDVTKQGEHINANVKWTAGQKGNYWSSYRGYDKDRDGIGDLPYRVEQIAELDIDPHSPSQALLYTPGYLVLESATRLFPIFKGDPVLEDTAPLTSPEHVIHPTVNDGNRSVVFSALSAMVLLGGSVSVVFFKPFDKKELS